MALKVRTPTAMNPQNFKTPEIVSPAEWRERRKALLADEKALTRQRDRLNETRRALPMVEITKDYVFDTSEGTKHLTPESSCCHAD